MVKQNAINTEHEEFKNLKAKEKIELFKQKIKDNSYETLELFYGEQLYVTLYLINKTYDSFHLYGIFEPNIDELSGKDGIVSEMYVNAKEKEYYVKRNFKDVQFSARNIRGMLRFANKTKFFDFIEHENIKGVFQGLYTIGREAHIKKRQAESRAYINESKIKYALNDFFVDYVTHLSKFELLIKLGAPANQVFTLYQNGRLDLTKTKPHEVLKISKGAWKIINTQDNISKLNSLITVTFDLPSYKTELPTIKDKLQKELYHSELGFSHLIKGLTVQYDRKTKDIMDIDLRALWSRGNVCYNIPFGLEKFLVLPHSQKEKLVKKWQIEHQNLLIYLQNQAEYYGLDFNVYPRLQVYIHFKLFQAYIAPTILTNNHLDEEKILNWLKGYLPSEVYNSHSQERWLELADSLYDNILDMVKLMYYYQHDISRLFNYLKYETYLEQGISNGAINLLYDYIKMSMDMNTPYIQRYPSSLRLEHDTVAMNYKVVIDEKKEEKWAEWYNRSKELEYTPKKEEFAVILPKKAQELVQEGNAFNHCVGSYVDSVLKGSTSVLFLRDKENLTTPLYTMEIRNERITQLRGKFNQPATEKAKEFARQYAKEKKLIF